MAVPPRVKALGSVPAVRLDNLVSGRMRGRSLLACLESLPVPVANFLVGLLGRLRLLSTQEHDSPGWHSFDCTPWEHPWLTRENLERIREFSRGVRRDLMQRTERLDADGLVFACVGNIANYLYERAIPLRAGGTRVDMILHPHDHYVMSEPGWEHFAESIPPGLSDVRDLARSGVLLPTVEGVVRPPVTVPGLDVPDGKNALSKMLTRYPTLRGTDFVRFPEFFNYLPALLRIAEADALLTTQALYLAYLSGRPYLATQMGGDFWFECSRGDSLGAVQRRAYESADAILASNPWTFAHARRFGMRNSIYLPYYLDETRYSPGHGSERERWRAKVGGDFFVLCTGRLDDRYKGSRAALEGIRRFMHRVPGARLVLLGWGEDAMDLGASIADLSTAGRVLTLPVAGKRRLVDYLRSADCLVDQMVVGYFGSSALEGMACGCPVVMRLNLNQYTALCETGAPPVLQATDAAEVCGHLERMQANPQSRIDSGAALRQWFLENASGRRWAEEYRLLLTACAFGIRPSFAESPLAEPLAAEEIEYHAAQLRTAPFYPQYH